MRSTLTWAGAIVLACCLSACKKSSSEGPKTPMTLEEKGKSVAFRKGCMACHSLDGQKRQGPTFKGLFGTKRTVLTKGKERVVVADEAYIRRSISTPKADLVKAYRYSLMIKVPISEPEMKALVALIKSVGPKANTPPKGR